MPWSSDPTRCPSQPRHKCSWIITRRRTREIQRPKGREPRGTSAEKRKEQAGKGNKSRQHQMEKRAKQSIAAGFACKVLK